MQFIPAHIEKLTPGQRKFVNKRVQKYSKQTQYYAHTFNPKRGHGLPFCVKFPAILKYFEEIPRKHPWTNHHQGIYNGMFFVPAEPDQTPSRCIIPRAIFGKIYMNQAFKVSLEHKLLLHLKTFYHKLHIDWSKIVTLVNENNNFSKAPELEEAGTFFNYSQQQTNSLVTV